jgi:hypothetical protein
LVLLTFPISFSSVCWGLFSGPSPVIIGRPLAPAGKRRGAQRLRLTSFLTLSYCCIATDCACHAPGRAVYIFRSLHTWLTQGGSTRASYLRLPARVRCGRSLLENLRPSRPADGVVVLEVMGQFMHFDGVKPCFLKILHRHLLAPFAPRPSPPCANDTVMQCMHQIV